MESVERVGSLSSKATKGNQKEGGHGDWGGWKSEIISDMSDSLKLLYSLNFDRIQ